MRKKQSAAFRIAGIFHETVCCVKAHLPSFQRVIDPWAWSSYISMQRCTLTHLSSWLTTPLINALDSRGQKRQSHYSARGFRKLNWILAPSHCPLVHFFPRAVTTSATLLPPAVTSLLTNIRRDILEGCWVFVLRHNAPEIQHHNISLIELKDRGEWTCFSLCVFSVTPQGLK